ncbi:2OG-Fe(II) oxygenase [Azotobacter chroococcum]|uniref:2OG-Fe(II) oxygenase n=1 Tax=Azotobacter chroococcum TaxID=353 RepID=A0AAP9YFC2_9GAMM|nr:2OG-Fe(II) oxygenase [Azotobacter chroococcum]
MNEMRYDNFIQSASGFTVWHGAVPRHVCARTIDALGRADSKLGAVLRRGIAHHDIGIRLCTEYILSYANTEDDVANAIRHAGREAMSLAKLARARLDGPKFCCYQKDGFFRAHRDRSVDIQDPPSVQTRTISLVCLLNDTDASDGLPVFDGGALVLYVPGAHGAIVPVNVPLLAGSIVAFPSDLLHEVRPVRGGVRFSAVAWLYDVQPIRRGMTC